MRRLLRVRRVGKQNDVFRLRLRGGNHPRRRHERLVDVNAAAFRTDRQNFSTICRVVFNRVHRHDFMRRRVHGEHADFVHRREQIQHRHRAEVGQIHFDAAAAGRHGHAAGTIQRDDHRDAQLAMFAPHFHRDWHDALQRRLEITARPVGFLAARHRQSAAGFLHPRRQRFHAAHADLSRRNIFNHHGGKLRKFFERPLALRRCFADDFNRAAAQQFHEAGIFARRRNHQHRPRTFHADERAGGIVFGNRIVLRALNRDGVFVHTRRCRAVAEHQPRQPGGNLFAAGRNDFVAAPELILDFLVRRRLHPCAQDERLAGQDRLRREKTLDGRVADLRTREQAIIHRHAATGGARGGGGGVFARPFAVGQNEDAPAAVRRNQRERGFNRVVQAGMVRADLCRKPAKLAALRRLFDDGIASERNDAELVARPHGFVQQADDFLFRRIGILRHGLAAVGDDNHVPARSGSLIASWANARTTRTKITARKIFSPRFGSGHANHAAASGTSSNSQTG